MSLREEIADLESRYLVHTYRRAPFVLDRGEGVYLFDTDGRRYLDFGSGIAVNALGYGDREVIDVINEQTSHYFHVSNLFHSEPMTRLAQLLVEKSFGDRIFFCNSGTEANEAAIKFARKWGRVDGQDRYEIVVFDGAFHGRTVGALTATPREAYQAAFRPLMGGVNVAHFNDLESAAAAVTPKTCAIMVEPIQGEGGIHLAEPAFLQGLRRLCNQRNLALIFDEVQVGLGRTGRLWAYEHSSVTPDIMTLAKPLGGGLPIGAAVLTERVASAIAPGDHGSTFAGNALIARVAQVVVRRISEPSFLERVQVVSQYLGEQLRELAARKGNIVDVRGQGLIWAIELSDDAGRYVGKGYEQGLIMLTAGAKILRLVPPLVIERQHVDELMGILDRVLPGNG